MRTKSALLALVSLVLVGVIAVGATLAYLTDSQEAKTTYVLGNVNIKLEEPIWEAGNSGQQDYFNGEKGVLSPGRVFTKDPTIYIDSDSADCYIRLQVTIDNDLWNVIELPQANSGWIVSDVQTTAQGRVYYYTYNQKVTKSDHNKPLRAFEKVEVLAVPRVPGDHEVLLEKADGKNLSVIGQAIQADGFTSADEAFTAFGSFKGFAEKT